MIGDGFVVVTYRKDLPKSQVASLRRWVMGDRAPVVAGPLDGQKEPVLATTARSELTCPKVHVDSLATFRDDWLDEVRELSARVIL